MQSPNTPGLGGFLTQWANATSCDQSCGPGRRVRYRSCDDICPADIRSLEDGCDGNLPANFRVEQAVETETTNCPGVIECTEGKSAM